MIWILRSPWALLVAAITLLILWGGAFWLYYGAYERKYFTDKALKVAALRATILVVWYGITFGLVFAAVTALLPPGQWRFVVGTFVWWLVSTLTNELVWQPFQAILDRQL